MTFIMTMTSCFVNGITLEQMTSNEKLHPRYRDVFVAWRSKVYSATRALAKAESGFGGDSGAEIAIRLTGMFLTENERNDLELYDGNITWGAYNRKRKELAKQLQGDVPR